MNAVEALRRKVKDSGRDDIPAVLTMITNISEHRLQELIDGQEPTPSEMRELESARSF